MREVDGKLIRECAGIEGSHEYSEKTCPKCGAIFCYTCCLGQNVDQGGKYEPDFMLCPACGHDIYR